jgi:hypothetical protein
MENLAHSASFHSNEKSAPSKPGTKQLARKIHRELAGVAQAAVLA